MLLWCTLCPVQLTSTLSDLMSQINVAEISINMTDAQFQSLVSFRGIIVTTDGANVSAQSLEADTRTQEQLVRVPLKTESSHVLLWLEILHFAPRAHLIVLSWEYPNVYLVGTDSLSCLFPSYVGQSCRWRIQSAGLMRKK